MRRLLALSLLLAAAPARAADPVTFEQASAVFRAHCRKCHNADERKGDLSLDTVADVLKGGSGGPAAVPGRPSKSLLYRVIAQDDDTVAAMPPKGKLPDADIAVIKAWIEQGLKATAADASKAPARDLGFAPQAATLGRPAGPPPMPQALPALTAPEPRRPPPVTALAANPWSPLVAAAGHERVLLSDAGTGKSLGALPFPDGVPFVLAFSRDGRRLLAAGGKPVRSGAAVLFDVATGKRLATFGDEPDAVLAADLSADQRRVALGGPGKVVKVFNTADGKFAYKVTKHTDWITAVAFSPDGTRLATADRAGGVHVWDAATGGILLSLSEHKDAVTALAWRPDGKVLATGSEDGRVIVWDAADGWPVTDRVPPRAGEGKTPGATAGILALIYTPQGELVAAGRDRTVRVVGTGSDVPLGAPLAALPLKVACSHEGRKVAVGDDRGEIQFVDLPVKK
ncbi:repeat-containing protein : WD-40 repeat protein OS=Solibacter usitatus (strain Ellin6076) GN=Acid_5038 PE=4 SV=1: PSCyt1: WD40: WD40 [Gemmataceae bacterium]|nr:repeat-containing protein : WD-40 repeat protein OS=Solibacter usitatus (strain Ellin6076) GN=Acid_5038 PE=4 SV=1: PSCyt1: WD40: WD40 [Gemmataceae bacterium]VTU01790.1 repeat-containing protein : WD-40 repeat protein OS=Solibacter usitatus (strain Ellin6076) GN=Acid_5038 PE=4 SV=1: PSCyt1: WD40: WD40 [Gemmataceae bacterium]